MNDDSTTVGEVLAGLRQSNPDAARSASVRARCRKEMARPRFRRPFESALVGGFCAVYFSLLTLIALRTHGLL